MMVVVGAWFKRYLIVTPTLLHPFLPMRMCRKPIIIIFQAGKNGLLPWGPLSGALLVITFFAQDISDYSNS